MLLGIGDIAGLEPLLTLLCMRCSLRVASELTVIVTVARRLPKRHWNRGNGMKLSFVKKEERLTDLTLRAFLWFLYVLKSGALETGAIMRKCLGRIWNFVP